MTGWLPLRTALILAALAAGALAALAFGLLTMVDRHARDLAAVGARADAEIIASKVASLPAGLTDEERDAEIHTLVAVRAAARCDPALRDRALFALRSVDGRTVAATAGVVWPDSPGPDGTAVFSIPAAAACRAEAARAVGAAHQLPGGWALLTARVYSPDPALVAAAWRLAALIGAAFLIVAALMALALNRSWRAGIERLNALLDRADAQAFSQRADETAGPTELRLLSRHLNALLGRIGTMLGALERLHRHVAHDLRAPAMVARRLIAAKNEPELADIDDKLETIERRCRTLLGMIDAQALRAAPVEAFDAAARVRALVDDMFVYLGDDKELDFAVTGGPAQVALPPDLFDRAVENLLGNAVKFADRSSTVRSDVTRDAGTVRITIENDGPQVAEKDMERIFEPGYSNAAAGGTGGHGLGLALVRSVAEGWGGTVRAANGAQGFSIEMTLPLAGSNGA